MNWHFCIDSLEKQALDLCYDMGGDGKGCGTEYGASSGAGFGGNEDFGSTGEIGLYGSGNTTPGDGIGYGHISHLMSLGDGFSNVSWL